jgi:K+-transporting ATPase KdpF subunit
MSTLLVFGGVTATGLLVYLIFALLAPEKLQ